MSRTKTSQRVKQVRPTYPGPSIEPDGIASTEVRRAVCTYVTTRWHKMKPNQPRYPDYDGEPQQGDKVDPYGTLVVGPNMNYYINLGGYGQQLPDDFAAVEANYPNVKAAFDAWAAWAGNL